MSEFPSPVQSDQTTFPPPAQTPVTYAVAPVAGLQHNGGGWTCAGAPLSSAGRRLGAYLLDGLLLVVTLGIGWLIWSLVAWSKGQTPAKQLMKMRCVKPDTGRVATWGSMALREIVGKGILGMITFGITTIVSWFTILGASRQGVWDKVAGTVVVDDPQGTLV
jgi:uncharacterized RDD family membrane protein YckC